MESSLLDRETQLENHRQLLQQLEKQLQLKAEEITSVENENQSLKETVEERSQLVENQLESIRMLETTLIGERETISSYQLQEQQWNSQRTSLEEQSHQLREDISAKAGEITTLTTQLAERETTEGELRRVLSELNSHIELETKELELAAIREQQLSSQLVEQTHQLEELGQQLQLQLAEITSLKENVSQLEVSLSQSENQLASYRQLSEQLQTQIQTQQEEILREKKINEELNISLGEKQQSIENQQSSIHQLEESLSAERQVVVSFQQQQIEWETTQQSLQQQAIQLNGEITVKSERILSLEREVEGRIGNENQLTLEMQQLNSRIEEQASALEQVKG